MLQELKFYTIDVAALGSDTEDDTADEGAEAREFQRLLMGDGIDDEDAAGGNSLEKVMKEVNEMDLDEERTQIFSTEQSI